MFEGTLDLPAQRRAAAEARLATIAPGFLDRVREAAGRLGLRDLDSTDARAALLAVEDLALIDLDVPTASRLPLVPIVKKAVKRLVGWYLSYFGRQLSAFGQAVTHLGGILIDRTERVEATTGVLQADVARLSDRVTDLEQRASGHP
jgi:hypothetical protein